MYSIGNISYHFSWLPISWSKKSFDGRNGTIWNTNVSLVIAILTIEFLSDQKIIPDSLLIKMKTCYSLTSQVYYKTQTFSEQFYFENVKRWYNLFSLVFIDRPSWMKWVQQYFTLLAKFSPQLIFNWFYKRHYSKRYFRWYFHLNSSNRVTNICIFLSHSWWIFLFWSYVYIKYKFIFRSSCTQALRDWKL